MPLISLGLSILLLLPPIARLKLNAFIALLLASLFVGVVNQMAPEAVLKSILRGIGDTVGSLLLILVFGAMLENLIEESGAAHLSPVLMAWCTAALPRQGNPGRI